jgi:hypothetical protein
MPTSFAIDAERRVVLTAFSGIIIAEDVIGHFAALRGDSAFQPTFSEIVDLSDASDVRLGYEDLKRLSEMDPFSRTSKRAFVIPSNPVVFGVTRMYQLLQNEDPRIQIFRSLEQARAWMDKAA